ncbi:MAG: 4Fe-4S binding protein [Opitutales bacterium]
MGRIFNIIIFILLLCLIVIANGKFLGVPIQEEKSEAQSVEFDLKQEYNVIYTMPYTKNISGYGGAIPLAIAVDKNNVVLDIQILKNAEDPSYLGEVIKAKYTSNWVGLSIAEVADKKVNALSGATLSSTAIAKSMKARARQIIGAENEKAEIDYEKIIKISALLFVILTGFLSFYFPAKFAKYRTFLLFSNIMILGVWQGAMLSVFTLANWLINGIPSIYGYLLLVIFLISILVPIFTKKNYYCTYVCPFGASQELVAKAIRIDKISIKKLLFKGLNKARIIILISCFILLILGLGENIALAEPFSAFNPSFASKVAVGIFVVSLILSMFTPRIWCNYFCPMGAFLDLFKSKAKKAQK